jgi:hypothetical protein
LLSPHWSFCPSMFMLWTNHSSWLTIETNDRHHPPFWLFNRDVMIMFLIYVISQNEVDISIERILYGYNLELFTTEVVPNRDKLILFILFLLIFFLPYPLLHFLFISVADFLCLSWKFHGFWKVYCTRLGRVQNISRSYRQNSTRKQGKKLLGY